jgi:hypothetical protein
VEEGTSPTPEGEGEGGEEEDGDGSSHSTIVEDSVSLRIYYLYYRNSLIDRLHLLKDTVCYRSRSRSRLRISKKLVFFFENLKSRPKHPY